MRSLRGRWKSFGPGRTSFGNPFLPGINGETVNTLSLFGGGTTPERSFPSAGLALATSLVSADELARRLRVGKPPVVARVERGKVILDFRTIFPEEDEVVVEAVRTIVERV